MDITNAILATGALGAAAFGIVEALKFTGLGNAGFSVAIAHLGPLLRALEVAYGTAVQDLLRGQYRADDKDLLARTLRQGVRVGLTEQTADAVAAFLGAINAARLKEAVTAAEQGSTLTAEQRNVLGRFELAADARIDAALTLARARYVDATRITASTVALVLALVVGWNMPDVSMLQAFIVGLAAVPLAPIAKDVASGIQSAARALKGRA